MLVTTSTAAPPAPPRALLAGATTLTAAVAVQGAANLAFHAVVSRRLGPEAYGALGVLLAVVLLLTVPLGAVQAAIAKAVAAAPEGDHGPLLRRVALVGIGGTASVVVAAPLVQSFLHLESVTWAALLGPYVATASVFAALRGVGIGRRRFGSVASATVAATVARLALGWSLAGLFGVTGAIAATLLAELLGILWLLASTERAPSGASPVRVPARELATAMLAIGGLWVFTGIDLVLARHHLTDATAYVAAATVARCILALPLAVAMAALPTFAAESEAVARAALRRSLLVVAGAGLAAAVGLALLPGLVQQVLFGSRLAPTGLLVLLGAVAAASGLVTVITYYHLARGSRAAWLPWAGATVEVALIALAHGSAGAIATASLASAVVGVAVLLRSTATRPAGAVEPAAAAIAPEDTRLWEPADRDVELSVVVPFYNPGPSVGATVRRLVGLAREAGIGLEVIAVSDGSTDGSEAHLDGIGREVRVLVQPENRGKGAALRRGFCAARGRAVGFVDADGDIDPAHLLDYLEVLRTGGDIVYACKRSGASSSQSSGFRKLVSLGFSSVVTVLFRHGVRDTQTGCKILRREVAADVLPWMRENRFAFDLELFVVAHRRGHRDLRPAAVLLGERLAGSTVTARAILRTLRDALTIWGRLHVARAYPAAGGHVVAFPSAPADLVPLATAA